MAAPTVCTVSGIIRDLSGNALIGATVKAQNQKPFLHPTDSSIIAPYEISTTTANDGSWSLNLVETTTPNVTITIVLIYATGSSNPNDQREYSVQIPNAASATFGSLIGSQV